MTKSRWLMSLAVLVLINKEAASQPRSDDSLQNLSRQRQALVERIQQMRPGGTLAGRLIDLEARRNQLVRSYPEGNSDIRLLDQEISTTRAALQKLPALETEFSALNSKIDEANGRLASIQKKTRLSWLPRLHYEGRAFLTCSGNAKQMEEDLRIFRSHPDVKVIYEKVPGRPLEIAMQAEGTSPDEVVRYLAMEGQASVAESLGIQKAELRKKEDEFERRETELKSAFHQLNENRKALLAGPKRNTPRQLAGGEPSGQSRRPEGVGTPRAQLVAKIEELKARRRLLIERYPTHTDIPVLAKQIQQLASQMGRPSAPLSAKIEELDRRINEVKLRMDYFSRQLQETAAAEGSLKPSWKISLPIERPTWPNRVEGWPLIAGVVLGLLAAGRAMFQGKSKARQTAPADGLWKPEVSVQRPTSDVGPRTSDGPVELEVVSPTLPSDPLTEKAATLYARWVEVAKVLYAPAPEPPQGVLDSVGPLLQESSDFLPEGHDILAKYLARTVAPGNLPAHVARTVLMTLTGAEEAGVSPEHRLAMALAALFHDLAVVPRPTAIQEDVGSEVGRLSASVLRRIPGLQPALLSMVEEILIGMDEFKLETWQNVANGSNLEPLSKVLREIDRFEKVMQKQKSRLTRHVKAV